LTAFLALEEHRASGRWRALALGHAGLWNVALGDMAVGLRQLEEGRVLGREHGDQRSVAWATLWLGSFTFDSGDHATSRALIEESLALYRAQGDSWGIAQALIQLGRPVATQGDYQLARALLEEGQALARRSGDRRHLAEVLEVLGEVELAEGNLAEAAAAWQEELAISAEVQNMSGVATAEAFLGHLAVRQGDDTTARVHYAAALRYQGRGLIPLWAVQILGALAVMAVEQGEAKRSLCLAAAYAALSEATGVRSLYPGQALMEQAVAAARMALGERAAAAWAEGQAMTWPQATAYALDGLVPR
jgi:tetratricopeptide (TPR) repeat protein